jgi:hypothetical protein
MSDLSLRKHCLDEAIRCSGTDASATYILTRAKEFEEYLTGRPPIEVNIEGLDGLTAQQKIDFVFWTLGGNKQVPWVKCGGPVES